MHAAQPSTICSSQKRWREPAQLPPRCSCSHLAHLTAGPSCLLSLSLSARCTRDLSIVSYITSVPIATRNGASNMSRRTCRRPRPAKPPPFWDEQQQNDYNRYNSSAPLKRAPRRPRPPGDPPVPTVTTEILCGKGGVAGVVVAPIPADDNSERSAPAETTGDGEKYGRQNINGVRCNSSCQTTASYRRFARVSYSK